jgi:hypothetical protein
MNRFDRITRQLGVMDGKATRGMRVPVRMMVGQIGAGRSVDELFPTIRTSLARMSPRPSATGIVLLFPSPPKRRRILVSLQSLRALCVSAPLCVNSSPRFPRAPKNTKGANIYPPLRSRIF